jgi:CHAD domain-containing protein
MLEEERKYQVDAGFTMPGLGSCLPRDGRVVPRPPVTLRATYYDTEDRRLARAGVSLRHRRGEAPAKAWTLKLPSDTIGTRHEISRPGDPADIPEELRRLVTVYARGVALAPAALVRTVRRAYELVDRDNTVLAEVADDSVKVLNGRQVTLSFREIEVERVAGRSKLLDRVGAALCAAGAVEGDFTPKHVRALGAVAAQPPDLVPPDALTAQPSAGAVVVAALRQDIGRIFAFDPFVRLGDPLPNGDTPVHQMRVGCRRLRSDLRTFRPLLEAAWATTLRDELSWIADVLGAARDAEVLRARLHKAAGADPLAPIDGAMVARIDADLARRHEDALTALDAALRTDRYLALLELLLTAATQPPLTRQARKPASESLPRLVAKPWHRLSTGDVGLHGAGSLQANAPDEDWHAVRIRAKRARYATEAVAGVLGGGAAKLAKALAGVQEVLGDHQDAAVAAQTWLDVAAADPQDHALAVAAGRLFERERVAVRQARADFGPVWHAANRKKALKWLA